MMKKKVLYVGAEEDIWDVPSNAGITEVLASIALLGLTRADTRAMSREETKDVYLRAATSTATTKHRIRNVFSSNRGEPGLFLGRQVPAMVVFAEDGTPEDVFPHLEAGTYITIAEALGAETM